MPRMFKILMICSYSLLFGCGLVVLVGGIYVLFFAPLQATDPSSLNQNSPLWHKIAFIGFVVCVISIGYVINRVVWSRVLGR
jgi:quinol-cytochrome oxidoreductase complex cytochrome b subunit